MIRFRCWYCNKRYAVADERIGTRITCTCERLVRVPKRNGGPCRVRTPIDYLVEAIVYGGGGALLGLGLALLILAAVGRGLFVRGTYGFLTAMNYAISRHLRVAKHVERRRVAAARQDRVDPPDPTF